MKLVDQWRAIEDGLPPDWDDVRLTLTTEQPGDLARAAQVLGPINVGKIGSALTFQVRRAGGHQSPQAATRLFERLDHERTWCRLEQSHVHAGEATIAPSTAAATVAGWAQSLAGAWDAALAPLPTDWTDLLCELELDSSDYLDRAALLCAPLNLTRDASRLAFNFRCSGGSGYGVSSAMARRCFERLDQERIVGSTRVLRVVSDTDNVDTQGPVWLVGGKTL
jgi:hypothetical protein